MSRNVTTTSAATAAMASGYNVENDLWFIFTVLDLHKCWLSQRLNSRDHVETYQETAYNDKKDLLWIVAETIKSYPCLVIGQMRIIKLPIPAQAEAFQPNPMKNS